MTTGKKRTVVPVPQLVEWRRCRKPYHARAEQRRDVLEQPLKVLLL